MSSSPCCSGLWTGSLNGPRPVQSSFQNLIFVPSPGIHGIESFKSWIPPFSALRLAKPHFSFKVIFWWDIDLASSMYFICNVPAHLLRPSLMVLQYSLARPLYWCEWLCRSRPPTSLGLVTWSHLTSLILLFSWLPPDKNLL